MLPLHFNIRTVADDDIFLPVGYLCGIIDDSGKRETNTENFGKLVVMGGFISSDVDKLLSAMRKAGFGRDVLKAVVTPTNAVWCGAELYAEILKEHLQMGNK